MGMNRIYQGEVTAVEIPHVKDAQDRPLDIDVFWRHHHLFQVDGSESSRHVIYKSLLSVSMAGRGAVLSTATERDALVLDFRLDV